MFALRPAPQDQPKLLYDLELLKETGRPGEPIGELKIREGKQSVVFFKK